MLTQYCFPFARSFCALISGLGWYSMKRLLYMPRGSYQLLYPRKDHSRLVQLFGGRCSTYLVSRQEDLCCFMSTRQPVTLMPHEWIMLSYIPQGYSKNMFFFYRFRGRSLCEPVVLLYILTSRCSSSRCICLPSETFLLLYEVCDLPCEVYRPNHLFCDFCLLLSLEKSLQVPLRWPAISYRPPWHFGSIVLPFVCCLSYNPH